MGMHVTFLSLNKKVNKEVSLRGANVALPRARYALLRISRIALLLLRKKHHIYIWSFNQCGGGINKG